MQEPLKLVASVTSPLMPETVMDCSPPAIATMRIRFSGALTLKVSDAEDAAGELLTPYDGADEENPETETPPIA